MISRLFISTESCTKRRSLNSITVEYRRRSLKVQVIDRRLVLGGPRRRKRKRRWAGRAAPATPLLPPAGRLINALTSTQGRSRCNTGGALLSN
ncbi:hypothetical protein EVAR_93716_1 [Eumeta japonica]|uniref:Uncharacterized protein n=1 Tax=Eumeta variegata TaxID=151549 RepID=A0A4C1U2R4_EUMVA|nr:hypothetical protein EVAR_93716_1 [Eumeta japonica]